MARRRTMLGEDEGSVLLPMMVRTPGLFFFSLQLKRERKNKIEYISYLPNIKPSIRVWRMLCILDECAVKVIFDCGHGHGW